jgi:hypothetical protein
MLFLFIINNEIIRGFWDSAESLCAHTDRQKLFYDINQELVKFTNKLNNTLIAMLYLKLASRSNKEELLIISCHYIFLCLVQTMFNKLK